MNSEVLRELDQRCIWHPYTQHSAAEPPTVIARARGAYVYDAAGRQIIDAISSWWVTTHGHAEPSIAAAIAAQAEQLEQVIFAGFTHEPATLLARELTAVLPPGLARVFYSDDGSTAVEVAVKIALQYWRNRGEERRLIAALDHAYHGDTFGAMSAGARGAFTAAFDDHLFEVARLPSPDCFDTAAAFIELLENSRERIAALIVEPLLMGAGGMRVWDSGTLSALAATARDAGVLLIADEVLTGFGRTGPMFACEHARVSPDIICLSKGLTGGFLPLGATVVTEDVFANFLGDRTKTLFHGHSFTANPVACAAARANLRLFDETCTARRSRIETAHRSHLRSLSGHPRVTNARVIGTVAAFDIDANGGSSYFAGTGRELAGFALQHGVLLRPLGNVVYVLPPYCTSESDLDRVYAAIAGFLDR
jgi:adenosylmethionine---8-amino-7-oxononanoate aminotransferase